MRPGLRGCSEITFPFFWLRSRIESGRVGRAVVEACRVQSNQFGLGRVRLRPVKSSPFGSCSSRGRVRAGLDRGRVQLCQVKSSPVGSGSGRFGSCSSRGRVRAGLDRGRVQLCQVKSSPVGSGSGRVGSGSSRVESGRGPVGSGRFGSGSSRVGSDCVGSSRSVMSFSLTNARFSLDLCTGPPQYLNYTFTGIFIVEACVRLIALRLDYFKQGWNLFDFTIVVFSIVGESTSISCTCALGNALQELAPLRCSDPAFLTFWPSGTPNSSQLEPSFFNLDGIGYRLDTHLARVGLSWIELA